MRRRPQTDDLPSARATLRSGYVRVLVFCNSCRHQADADLQAIIDAGRGDMPLTELRFRCSRCGTDRTDFVVTSRDNPRPWLRHGVCMGRPVPATWPPGR